MGFQRRGYVNDCHFLSSAYFCIVASLFVQHLRESVKSHLLFNQRRVGWE